MEESKIPARIVDIFRAHIGWNTTIASALASHITAMQKTPQNPMWHGEGDVWTHTELVLDALTADPDYQAQDARHRAILFVAALLHDVAKPVCTVYENGVPTSPRHTIRGAAMARTFLWRDCGLCGTPSAQSFRETVCALVRHHGMPWHLGERQDPERKLIQVAALGEVAPDFSLALLHILVRADLLGRVAADTAEKLADTDWAFLLATELGIQTSPYRFPNLAAKHAYLGGKQVARDYPLHDTTWGEVVLVAGLPGTGKDHYIRHHFPDLAVLSPDEIRREMHISPADRTAQGKVFAEAHARAAALLRANRPFVWNATNLSPQLRQKQLDLFRRYGAATRIVFLETDMETEFARNRGRDATVPPAVILHMLQKTEPPTPDEAYLVEWLCT